MTRSRRLASVTAQGRPWLRAPGWMCGLGSMLAVLVSVPGGGSAQMAPAREFGVRVVRFQSDPQPVEFARPFGLRALLRLPPGSVVTLPDTLVPTDGAASAGPGNWSIAAGPGDSVDIEVEYPVMAFRAGRVELPWLPLELESDAGAAAGGAAIDLLVPIGAVEVRSLAALDRTEGEVRPRPFADVLGGEWSAWAFVALALAILAMAWGIGAAVAAWRERSGGAPMEAVARPSARGAALAELDRIRSPDWLAESGVLEFYTATSDALRDYAEGIEPGWVEALTSSELVDRFERRWGRESIRRVGRAVETAERVKFGGLRPDVDQAEDDWEAIRDWVRDFPKDR